MAKFTATTVNALRTEIMRRANLALKNEIASTVKERLKTHVQKDVYSTYSPSNMNGVRIWWLSRR